MNIKNATKVDAEDSNVAASELQDCRVLLMCL